jgi:hypothetical protein
LVKAERAKGLHTIEEDVCVRYYTWKKGQGLVGQAHASSLQSAVFRRVFHLGAGSDGALRANACPSRKKLADSPACECGRGNETVLHVLLRCDRYAEACKVLREAAGDRWGDASFLLGE